MRRNIKTILTLSLALVLCIGVTGCKSKKAEEDTSKAEQGTVETVEKKDNTIKQESSDNSDSTEITYKEFTQEEIEEEKAQADELYNEDNWRDFTGTYVDGNGNEITLTSKSGKSVYDVTLRIAGQDSITGEGNWVDEAIEISLTDPDGNIMYGVLYTEDGKTFTYISTESYWQFLPNQARIDFKLK